MTFAWPISIRGLPMFSQLVSGLLKKKSEGPPTITKSTQEAASNYLGKVSKLETAREGIFTDDLRKLAAADRERVAAYVAATVPSLAGSAGSTTKGSSMGGDFIVCDDYRKGTGTISALVMGAVAFAALGIGGLGLWTAMRAAVDPPAVTAPPADNDTLFELRLVPGDESAKTGGE